MDLVCKSVDSHCYWFAIDSDGLAVNRYNAGFFFPQGLPLIKGA